MKELFAKEINSNEMDNINGIAANSNYSNDYNNYNEYQNANREINIPYFMLEGNNARKIKVSEDRNDNKNERKSTREERLIIRAIYERNKRLEKIRKIKFIVKNASYAVEFGMLYLALYLGGLMEHPFALNSTRIFASLVQAAFGLACIILLERNWNSIKRTIKSVFR